MGFIRELELAGPREFNSHPYQGYTAMALLTLEAYAAEPGRAARTDLTDHPHTAMMRVRVSLHADARYPVDQNEHHAVYAALMPYRLPRRTAETALSVDRDHFVRIGRGPEASPELYAAGPGYLISSGGTGRPARVEQHRRPARVCGRAIARARARARSVRTGGCG